jgi:predicted phage tail protein
MEVFMSTKRKAGNKARHEKRVELEATTRGKFRLAVGLAVTGGVLLLTGLLLGRGAPSGSSLWAARFFMLVLGVSLLLAGAVGLIAHVLVLGANKQVNKRH